MEISQNKVYKLGMSSNFLPADLKPQYAWSPNSSSKLKQVDKMNKLELMEEVKYYRQKEGGYERLINELKQVVKEVKDELNEIGNRRVISIVRDNCKSRAAQIELKMARQVRYLRWE